MVTGHRLDLRLAPFRPAQKGIKRKLRRTKHSSKRNSPHSTLNLPVASAQHPAWLKHDSHSKQLGARGELCRNPNEHLESKKLIDQLLKDLHVLHETVAQTLEQSNGGPVVILLAISVGRGRELRQCWATPSLIFATKCFVPRCSMQ